MCAHITKTTFITRNAFNTEFHSDFGVCAFRLFLSSSSSPSSMNIVIASIVRRAQFVCPFVCLFRFGFSFAFVCSKMLSFEEKHFFLFFLSFAKTFGRFYINVIYILYCSLTQSSLSEWVVCLGWSVGWLAGWRVLVRETESIQFLFTFFLAKLFADSLWVDVSVEWNCTRAAQRHKDMTTKSDRNGTKKCKNIFQDENVFHSPKAHTHTPTRPCKMLSYSFVRIFRAFCRVGSDGLTGKIKIALLPFRFISMHVHVMLSNWKMVSVCVCVWIFRFGQFLLNAFKLPLVGDWFSVFFACFFSPSSSSFFILFLFLPFPLVRFSTFYSLQFRFVYFSCAWHSYEFFGSAPGAIQAPANN